MVKLSKDGTEGIQFECPIVSYRLIVLRCILALRDDFSPQSGILSDSRISAREIAPQPNRWSNDFGTNQKYRRSVKCTEGQDPLCLHYYVPRQDINTARPPVSSYLPIGVVFEGGKMVSNFCDFSWYAAKKLTHSSLSPPLVRNNSTPHHSRHA